MALNDRTRIIDTQIEDEMKTSYIDYSMSVIVSRALPDVRDGLKPSQRRILVAMNDLNLAPGRGYRKCAKIAGDTSGNYHPHGEGVVYPTLVRLAQDWVMRYPLVDGQGNFGSIDGDAPAAMRYTEARLTHLAVEMLADLEKNTVEPAAQLRRDPRGADRAPGRAAEPARQRLLGHRGGHGDRGAAAQPRARSATPSCTSSSTRTPRPRTLAQHRQGPGLPHGRHHLRDARASATATRPGAASSRCARGSRSRRAAPGA